MLRSDSEGGLEEDETVIVAPPEVFSGDNCATPTPGDFSSHTGSGMDSGTSTPRYSDSLSTESMTGKASPLTMFLAKAEKINSKPRSSSLTHSLQEHQVAKTTSGSSVRDDDDDTRPDLHTKLYIAPHDSPAAKATSRILSILSSSQHNLKPSGTKSSSEDNPDYSLTSLPRHTSSLESESLDSVAEGTDM